MKQNPNVTEKMLAERVMLIYVSVTSRLDYFNMFYMGLPLKTIQKFPLVQNAAAHLLFGTSHQDHITFIRRIFQLANS